MPTKNRGFDSCYSQTATPSTRPVTADTARVRTPKSTKVKIPTNEGYHHNGYDGDEHVFPEEAFALLTPRGRQRVVDRGLNSIEILKSPRFIEACYRLGLRPSEVNLYHSKDYSRHPRPRFPAYSTMGEKDLPLEWKISCLAEALEEYDTIIRRDSYTTQSFNEWLQGRPATAGGNAQKRRSVSCDNLRLAMSPEEFAALALTRMQSHVAKLERQQAAFMDNEARRERARSRSAQRMRERDDMIYHRAMTMVEKDRRQQLLRQRLEQQAEATKQMRNNQRGDRFKRNKRLQEQNREELLRAQRKRDRKLAEALAARAEARRAKKAALVGAEKMRKARRDAQRREDQHRKLVLTEELASKDTRSKEQLFRNRAEFEVFVKEAHRKRAISEHLVERRRRKEKYFQNAEADRQTFETACDVEMKRMTLAMKRQKAEYDRQKFQRSFAESKRNRKRRPRTASVPSLLNSPNHQSVLPRSPEWSLGPRIALPGHRDSGLGPGTYDIHSTVGADCTGPRWVQESMGQSDIAESPIRYEVPSCTSSPPRSPSMHLPLRPYQREDRPAPGHRHTPVEVHRLPRPRDPRNIARHFRLLVEKSRQHLHLVGQSKVTAAAVASHIGDHRRGLSHDAEMEEAAAELTGEGRASSRLLGDAMSPSGGASMTLGAVKEEVSATESLLPEQSPSVAAMPSGLTIVTDILAQEDDRRDASPTRTTPGLSRWSASPFGRNGLPNISESPSNKAVIGPITSAGNSGLVTTVDVKAVPANEFPMVPSITPLPAHVHQHHLKPGRHSSLLPNSSQVDERHFIDEDGTLLRSAISSLPARLTEVKMPQTIPNRKSLESSSDGAVKKLDEVPGVDLNEFVPQLPPPSQQMPEPFFFPFPHDPAHMTRFPPSAIQDCELRVKRLEKLAARLTRKENLFDGLRTVAKSKARPNGWRNHKPFRIGPFDHAPDNGELPVAADSWPPFARYDSEGLLGLYGGEVKPYVIGKRSVDVSTTRSRNVRSDTSMGSLPRRARTSPGLSASTSLPTPPREVSRPATSVKRSRQQRRFAGREPRVPVEWSFNSKLSRTLHLWTAHEEKKNWAWRTGPIPCRGRPLVARGAHIGIRCVA
ncbi:hypothetical protein FOL47_007972 [Perkinsus chesapeaki]|uniref:Uncharacterized protein n=1 Tax=Perkinsus chesapeaki TaxID=330153 RepID=A0A7J6LH15_PERCH|nr:hypothetical protein FOL47_007972 [Perkinsus chesapeaki]